VTIVEDDPHVLAAIGRVLKLWHLDVQPYRTFEDARASLAIGAPPDVLIVDVRLGMFNGLHLAHVARQLNPETTVIVVSGFDDPLLRGEAERVGAVFLPKPVDLTALRRTCQAGGI
jgi:FixJ family two-component response regulator